MEKEIRNLAKNNEMQTIFSASKELNGIYLFKNKLNLSKLQRLFLSYLYFYHNLNLEIALKKVCKYVKNDFIYEDAYMLWRNEHEDTSLSKKKPKKNLDIKDIYLVIDNKK